MSTIRTPKGVGVLTILQFEHGNNPPRRAADYVLAYDQDLVWLAGPDDGDLDFLPTWWTMA